MPKPEGMQYFSEAHSEMHYMLLNILFRPLFLPRPDTCDSQTEQYLAAYRPLCTAPEGEPPWPAVARTADETGPFERSWHAFHREQRDLAERARQKSFLSQAVPNLWLTVEMQQRLQRLASAASRLPAVDGEPVDATIACSVQEYCAREVVQTAANFKGIAQARTQKQKREVDRDVAVLVEPVGREGGEEASRI